MIETSLNYLVSARWFQGKGLPVSELDWHPLPWYVSNGDIWVRSELVTLLVGGKEETYHLLSGYAPPGTCESEAVMGQVDLPERGLVDVLDVPCSPTAMAVFLNAVTDPASSAVEWAGAPPDPNAPTRVFAGEQSNTMVWIGDDMLLKVFRKLSPGASLEAITLADMASSQHTPLLIGVLEAESGYHLGLFVERIREARDGWEFCVERCRAGQSIADEMTLLGQALRRLHADLGQAYGAANADAADIGTQMMDRLDGVCQQLPELAKLQPRLRDIFTLAPGPVEVQRVHGDFHLGQALLSPRGWTIIDFEGEPLKSPAESATPDAVWRDVAGLCRSIDYARHGQDADDWYEEAREAFLTGYGDPPPPALLTAYELDKAIYELLYETRNRPAWADIPRSAIETAIAQM